MNKQELLTKYAPKFAAKPKSSRPVLEGIHYAADGTAYVTNSHFALRIKNVHIWDKDFTVHAKSGAPVDGVYPNIKRVFPDNKFEQEIVISKSFLPDVLIRSAIASDVAKKLNKSQPTIKLDILDRSAYLAINESSIDFRTFIGNTAKSVESKRTINAEYLNIALALFKDSHVGTGSIVIGLGKPLSPIIITDGEDIDVIILPYRTTD